MISSSLATQYGIRLTQTPDMSWIEFHNLVTGLMYETPMGRIISIRAETDKDQLKNFSKEHHAIRNEWRSKCNAKVFKTFTEEDSIRATNELQSILAKAFG